MPSDLTVAPNNLATQQRAHKHVNHFLHSADKLHERQRWMLHRACVAMMDLSLRSRVYEYSHIMVCLQLRKTAKDKTLSVPPWAHCPVCDNESPQCDDWWLPLWTFHQQNGFQTEND